MKRPLTVLHASKVYLAKTDWKVAGKRMRMENLLFQISLYKNLTLTNESRMAMKKYHQGQILVSNRTEMPLGWQ
jgi:hypothetical protein